MSKYFQISFNITLLLFVGIISTKCVMQENESSEIFNRPSVEIDLPEIIKKGKLVVLAENSSTSYFIYRGKKMGFEYELLKLFADDIGVELEIKIVKDLDSLIYMVNNGMGDIIACNYTITNERNKQISFSEPFIQTQQVLVQRKPDGWEKMNEDELNSIPENSTPCFKIKKFHIFKICDIVVNRWMKDDYEIILYAELTERKPFAFLKNIHLINA